MEVNKPVPNSNNNSPNTNQKQDIYKDLAQVSPNSKLQQLQTFQQSPRYQSEIRDQEQILLDSYRKNLDYSMPNSLLQHRQKQLKLQSLVYDSKMNMKQNKLQDSTINQQKYGGVTQIQSQSERNSPRQEIDQIDVQKNGLNKQKYNILIQDENLALNNTDNQAPMTTDEFLQSKQFNPPKERIHGRMSPLAQQSSSLYGYIDLKTKINILISDIYKDLAQVSPNSKLQQLQTFQQSPRYQSEIRDQEQILLDSYRKNLDYSMPNSLLQHRQKQLKLQSLVYDSKMNMKQNKLQDSTINQQKYGGVTQIQSQSERNSPRQEIDQIDVQKNGLNKQKYNILIQDENLALNNTDNQAPMTTDEFLQSKQFNPPKERIHGRMSPLAQIKQQFYMDIQDLKTQFRESYIQKNKEEKLRIYNLQQTQNFNEQQRLLSPISKSKVNPFSPSQMQKVQLQQVEFSKQDSEVKDQQFTNAPPPLNKSHQQVISKTSTESLSQHPRSSSVNKMLSTAQIYEQKYYPLDYVKELQVKSKISQQDQIKRNEIAKVKHIEVIQELKSEDQEEFQRTLEREFDQITKVKKVNAKSQIRKMITKYEGEDGLKRQEQSQAEIQYKYIKDAESSFMRDRKFSDSRHKEMIEKFVREKKKLEINIQNQSYLPSSSQRMSPRFGDSTAFGMRGQTNRSQITDRSSAFNSSYNRSQMFNPISPSSNSNYPSKGLRTPHITNGSATPTQTKPILFNFAKFAQENQAYFKEQAKLDPASRSLKSQILTYKRETTQKMESLNINMPAVWKQQEETRQMIERIKMSTSSTGRNKPKRGATNRSQLLIGIGLDDIKGDVNNNISGQYEIGGVNGYSSGYNTVKNSIIQLPRSSQVSPRRL
eukprot:403341573